MKFLAGIVLAAILTVFLIYSRHHVPPVKPLVEAPVEVPACVTCEEDNPPKIENPGRIAKPAHAHAHAKPEQRKTALKHPHYKQPPRKKRVHVRPKAAQQEKCQPTANRDWASAPWSWTCTE